MPAQRTRGPLAAAGRTLAWLWLALAAVLTVGSTLPAAERVVLQADVVGAIGPATARYIESVLDEAGQRGAALVVLRMDTPGGLEQSMRDINKLILASPVPVATFVAPSGARAASAGTFILYASHVAAMAPGTNLGAATPVQIGGGGSPMPGGEQPARPGAGEGSRGGQPAEGEAGGDGQGRDDEEAGSSPAAPAAGDAMSRKAVNDASAYIRGLAELRGRNVEWAERAVREAESLSASEALAMNVIDVVATDIASLLRDIDGRSVQVNGTDSVLEVAGLAVEIIEPGWLIELLSILTNPNIALILMMIGVYGLVFEFATPGSIGPGVVGVICLLLGMYALNLLPLDYAGVGLMLAGIAFMVAEAVTPAFGVLGLGGLVAFVIGASILVDADSPQFQISWQVIAGTAIASAAVLVLVVSYALRAQRRHVTTGDAELLDEPATVLEWQGEGGYVRARGERWQAHGQGDFAPGTRVRVTAVHGLTLEIAPRASQSQGDDT